MIGLNLRVKKMLEIVKNEFEIEKKRVENVKIELERKSSHGKM